MNFLNKNLFKYIGIILFLILNSFLLSKENSDTSNGLIQINVDDIDPENTLEKYFINIGKGKSLFRFSIGVNTLPSAIYPGGILFLTYNYHTNYTEYNIELKTFGTFNASSISEKNLDDFIKYHLNFELKKSSKYFDFPYLYDWSKYSILTDADQNLTLRGLLETGLGLNMIHIHGKKKNLKLFYELGIAYDYANLEAYTQNLSVFYIKNSFLFSWLWFPISGRYFLHYFHELYSPSSTSLNQSRIEMEGFLSFHFNDFASVSAGYMYIRFMQINDFSQYLANNQLVEQSMTFYLMANFQY